MRTIETIAVVFTAMTGLVVLLMIGHNPDRYRRLILTGPAIFRWFHYLMLWTLIVWSLATVVLDFAGLPGQTSFAMPWLLAVFMISWWPFLVQMILARREPHSPTH